MKQTTKTKKRANAAEPPSLLRMWGMAPAAPKVVEGSESQSKRAREEVVVHPFFAPSVSGPEAGATAVVARQEAGQHWSQTQWQGQGDDGGGIHVQWVGPNHSTSDEAVLTQWRLRERSGPAPAIDEEEVGRLASEWVERSEEMQQRREELEEGAMSMTEEWHEEEELNEQDKERVEAIRVQVMTGQGLAPRGAREVRWLWGTTMRAVEAWLESWSSREEEEEEYEGRGALAVWGQSGSGKSTLVEAAAQELGWAVLEVHGGQPRSGRLVQLALAEATQSSRGTGGRTLVTYT